MTGPPFVDVPLFWLLPQIAQAIQTISAAAHRLPADWSIRTIASFIGTFVTKFMAPVDLCLASIARATVRSVGVLRILAEELTLRTESQLQLREKSKITPILCLYHSGLQWLKNCSCCQRLKSDDICHSCALHLEWRVGSSSAFSDIWRRPSSKVDLSDIWDG